MPASSPANSLRSIDASVILAANERLNRETTFKPKGGPELSSM